MTADWYGGMQDSLMVECVPGRWNIERRFNRGGTGLWDLSVSR